MDNQNQVSKDTSPLYFWAEEPEDPGFLSQWYPAPFHDDQDSSIIYPTAEHYMMYHKAILFKDHQSATAILSARNPEVAKNLGRKVSGFKNSVWLLHREDIVRRGNLLKFTRPVSGSRDLRDRLLATGQRELVEASPYDKIWGVGFTADEAGGRRKEWGLNLMGKALTVVRAKIRNGEEEVVVTVEG